MSEAASPAIPELPDTTRRSNPLHVAEDTLSIIAFSLMTILPVYAMITRLLRLPDIPVNAVVVQQLTLYIAMLGGCLAARSQRLLGLSSMELLPEHWRPPVRIFTNLVLAAVCVCLAWASHLYIQSIPTYENLFPGLPKRDVLYIMPVGFAVIALRAVWHAGPNWLARGIAAIGLFIPYLIGFQLTPDTPHMFGIAMTFFIIAIFLGLPIFAVFSGLALLLYWHASSADQPGQVASVPLEMYRLVASPLLPSIPLFTLAGYFMVAGGATKRLLRVFTALFSWIPGGLAIATVAICTIFTFAGSGLTILSLGGLLVPMLIKTGYPEKFSIGLLTSSGSLGLLFPTSVPAILYCVYSLTKTNAGIHSIPITPARLFTGAILPELVMISCIAAYGIYKGLKSGAVRQPFSLREAGSSIWAAKWELLLPVIMIIGVFGGFGTLTEAAALTAFAAFIVETFIYRDLKLNSDFRTVFVECATIVGGILLILGVALGFTAYLIDQEVPATLITWVRSHVESKYLFLLLLNGALLLVGALMDIFAAILVVVPLLSPLTVAYGIDPVQMGVIFIANLELGYLHPPVGINLFLAAYRFKKPMGTVIWATLPFLAILMGTVLLITYVPWLTTAPLRWFNP